MNNMNNMNRCQYEQAYYETSTPFYYKQLNPCGEQSNPYDNREIANAIFEGARNARGGERQFAAGRGLAESNLHLFEPVQLLL
jgi:hypothetical protein